MRLVDKLAETTARCLARHEGSSERPVVLAAVSGGVDSTALGLALGELNDAGRLPGALVFGHVDHGNRPGSGGAARAVARLAEHLRVPSAIRRLALGEGASEQSMRDARYAALTEIAEDCGAGFLLTAHHADDDHETVLFRMLRGTGPRGLAGIPERRRLPNGLILLRPFLGRRRGELAAFVADAGWQPVEDPTNADLGYARNRIRHIVIPALRDRLGDRLDRALGEIARAARAFTELIEARANRILAESSRQLADWRIELDCGRVDPADRPFVQETLRVLHSRLRGDAPSRAWLERALDLADLPAGKRLETGGAGLLVERTRRGLLLLDPRRAGRPANTIDDLEIDAPPTRFGSTEWHLSAVLHDEPPLEPAPAAAGPGRALLDPRATATPLQVRSRRAGDRIRPLGAARSVDLRRYMQKRGVPRFDRDRLPLIVDSRDRIVWAPGLVVAEFARLRDVTGPCVELRAVPS